LAVRKFSPFPVLKQPKHAVYEALYNLNVAFESIAANIERLDDKALKPETLKLYRTIAEDLRAAINSLITEALHGRELKDWYRYGKEKIALEKRLK